MQTASKLIFWPLRLSLGQLAVLVGWRRLDVTNQTQNNGVILNTLWRELGGVTRLWTGVLIGLNENHAVILGRIYIA